MSGTLRRCSFCNNHQRYPDLNIVKPHVKNGLKYHQQQNAEKRKVWEDEIYKIRGGERVLLNGGSRICSNHFVDGYLSKAHPYPTLFAKTSPASDAGGTDDKAIEHPEVEVSTLMGLKANFKDACGRVCQPGTLMSQILDNPPGAHAPRADAEAPGNTSGMAGHIPLQGDCGSQSNLNDSDNSEDLQVTFGIPTEKLKQTSLQPQKQDDPDPKNDLNECDRDDVHTEGRPSWEQKREGFIKAADIKLKGKDSSNQFISGLSQFIQRFAELCYSSEFDSDIQITGCIYVKMDEKRKEKIVLCEKVNKQKTSCSSTYNSGSHMAAEPNLTGKNPTETTLKAKKSDYNFDNSHFEDMSYEDMNNVLMDHFIDKLPDISDSSYQHLNRFLIPPIDVEIENENASVTMENQECNKQKFTEYYNKNRYLCNECDIQFTEKWDLNKHLRIYHHIGLPIYKYTNTKIRCETSGRKRKVATKIDACYTHCASLKIHQHTKCANKCSFIKTDLIKNKKRPFMCEVCGKTFLKKSQFGKHLKQIHMGAMPFKCDLCGNCFKHNYLLKKHQANLHKGKKRLYCKVCRKSIYGEPSGEPRKCSSCNILEYSVGDGMIQSAKT